LRALRFCKGRGDSRSALRGAWGARQPRLGQLVLKVQPSLDLSKQGERGGAHAGHGRAGAARQPRERAVRGRRRARAHQRRDRLCLPKRQGAAWGWAEGLRLG